MEQNAISCVFFLLCTPHSISPVQFLENVFLVSLRIITDELYQQGGRIKEVSDQLMLHIKSVCVGGCVQVCVREREWWCAHPWGVSGERRFIQQNSAVNIRGAISSSALPLIGLIIILLTYCTDICILPLQRSLCLSNIISHPESNPHNVLYLNC